MAKILRNSINPIQRKENQLHNLESCASSLSCLIEVVFCHSYRVYNMFAHFPSQVTCAFLCPGRYYNIPHSTSTYIHTSNHRHYLSTLFIWSILKQPFLLMITLCNQQQLTTDQLSQVYYFGSTNTSSAVAQKQGNIELFKTTLANCCTFYTVLQYKTTIIITIIIIITNNHYSTLF